MAETFQLRVATPEKLVIDEQVSMAEVPGKDGYMGILPGHAPLLSALGQGDLTYSKGGAASKVKISGGFVEVFNDTVSVLADTAETVTA